MIARLVTVENLAALLGLINVALLVRRSIWNFAFGLGSVAIYAYVFYVARLYSDATLQFYYVFMQFYGWWNWSRSRNKDGLARIETMSTRERVAYAAGTLVASAAIGWMFRTQTNAAAPFMDATLGVTSVVAQYLLSVRKLENWILWTAVDVVYIGLYWWKQLFSTSALYAVFLVLSAAGLIEWLREYKSHVSPIPVEEPLA